MEYDSKLTGWFKTIVIWINDWRCFRSINENLTKLIRDEIPIEGLKVFSFGDDD